MTIYFTKSETQALTMQQAYEVTKQYLEERTSSYFLKGDELWVDHGGHGSGFQEQVKRVTKLGKSHGYELHAVDYDYTIECLKFRRALKEYAQAKSGDNGK